MNSAAIGMAAFACIFGGSLFGLFLRPRLPEHYLKDESKDLVKTGVGLIATMSALVLGLLVASAKGSFDVQRNEVGQMAANAILLDRVLAHYGPEAKEVREVLRKAVERLLDQLWLADRPQSTSTQPTLAGEALYDRIQDLTPKTEAQRSLQAQALKIAIDLGQTRWLLYAQRVSAISAPFVVVVVFWLAIIFASFGLFAPRNALVFATLIVCALSVSAALFLVLELDRPFEGMIRISDEPLRNVLHHLGLGQ